MDHTVRFIKNKLKHVIMCDKFACFDKGLFLAVFGIEEPQGFRG